MTQIEALKIEIARRMSELYEQLPDAHTVEDDTFTKEQANILGKYTALESLERFIETSIDPFWAGNGIYERSKNLEPLGDVDMKKVREFFDSPETPDEAAYAYENKLWESGYKDSGYAPQDVFDAFKAGAEWEKESIKNAVSHALLDQEIVHTNYDAEQCIRRRWNEEEKKWERCFSNCSICSFTCKARAKDFERLGKKQYVDEETGMAYWQ